jgi:chorismate-pyruvate lyase
MFDSDHRSWKNILQNLLLARGSLAKSRNQAHKKVRSQLLQKKIFESPKNILIFASYE